MRMMKVLLCIVEIITPVLDMISWVTKTQCQDSDVYPLPIVRPSFRPSNACVLKIDTPQISVCRNLLIIIMLM